MSFTEERLPSGQPAIKVRLVESCSHGWPSGTYSHLHTESVEISQSDHWVSHPELLHPHCSVCSYEQLWNESKLLQTFAIPECWKPLCPEEPSEMSESDKLSHLWALVEGGLSSPFALWWRCQQWDLLQVCIFKKSCLISWTHHSCNVPAKGPTICAKAIFQGFFF